MSNTTREPTPRLLNYLDNMSLSQYGENLKRSGFHSSEIIGCVPEDDDTQFVTELNINQGMDTIKFKTMMNQIRRDSNQMKISNKWLPNQCCMVFDLRTGVVLIGVYIGCEAMWWLFLMFGSLAALQNSSEIFWQLNKLVGPATLAAAFWFSFFLFIICGTAAMLGIYGGFIHSKKAIYLFYIFGMIRCLNAAINLKPDSLLSFFMLILWIYWTIIIRSYYQVLTV